MKKIGVCFWGGHGYPSNAEVDCIRCNCNIFDKVYMIADLNQLKLKYNIDRDNFTILDEDKFFDWIKMYFEVQTLPAYNFIADILTYNAANILKNVYEVLDPEDTVVCKFDIDAIVYNSVLLEYALSTVRDTLPTIDQAIRIWYPNDTYRNCGICFSKVLDEQKVFKDMISIDGIDPDYYDRSTRGYYNHMIKHFFHSPVNHYTQIGPHLANDEWSNSLIRSHETDYARTISNINLFPGTIAEGQVIIRKEKDKLGFHLTISDCKKYGYAVNSIEDTGSEYKLVIVKL